MGIYILVFSIVFSLLIIIFSIKTLVDTRNYYYKEFLGRKENGKN